MGGRIRGTVLDLQGFNGWGRQIRGLGAIAGMEQFLQVFFP